MSMTHDQDSATPAERRGPTDPPAEAVLPPRHPDAPEPGAGLGTHYAQCFGCGEDRPEGLHLRIEAGQGVSVAAKFEVAPAHQGAPGLIHGGLLATAFDEVMGSVSWMLRIPAVTGRLETDFVKPCRWAGWCTSRPGASARPGASSTTGPRPGSTGRTACWSPRPPRCSSRSASNTS